MTEQLMTKLLEYGIGGIFIAFLIYAIFKLWKAKESRDEYIRDQNTRTSKLIGNMTNVMRTLISKTNDLPSDLKSELEADLVQIKLGIKQINEHLRKSS